MRTAARGVLALVLAFTATDVVPRHAAGAAEDERLLAFSYEGEGSWQIYTVALPSGEVVRLTGDDPAEGQSGSPRWSPDGTRLAFVSDRDGDGDIYTMNPDGSDVRRLADRPGDQSRPAWSPDGGRIAFIEPGAKRSGIHLMLDDGRYVRRLRTKALEVSGSLDWSPCHGRILFSARPKRQPRVLNTYQIRPWNDKIRKIGYGNGDQRWNPGCRRLIFSSGRFGPPESSTLYTMGRKGKRRRVVRTSESKTYDRYHDDPAWSSDGRLLAYTYMDHACFYCTELRVFDTRTKEDRTLLSDVEEWFGSPDWRP